MTNPKHPSLTRRRALQSSLATLTTLAIGGRVPTPAHAQRPGGGTKPVVQLGLVTDVHHADKPPAGTRHYRDSLPKLEVALRTFVEEKVDAVLQLGDLIDAHQTVAAEEAALRKVSAWFGRTGIPSHFVLGNHCLALLGKNRFAHLAGCRDTHYRFDVGPMQVIVLDANYRADATPYDAGNFQWTDCFIPEPQLDWLGETLSRSDKPTIVLTHQRLDPDPHHTVANHEDVRKVIAQAGGKHVKAVFQGHSHRNQRVVFDEIPYIVLRGVIEGAGLENNAYSILQLYDDGSLALKGFGQQQHHAF